MLFCEWSVAGGVRVCATSQVLGDITELGDNAWPFIYPTMIVLLACFWVTVPEVPD